jgi:hypothetical protein
MFLLLLDGPHGGSMRTLLEMASTHQGRQGILEVLNEGGPTSDQPAETPTLVLMKCG